MNVLVVCLGNINRSPLCAAVLKRNAPNCTIKSAGFRRAGAKATLKMREQALALGYDLELHRSSHVTPAMLHYADYVVYMDGSNLQHLKDEGLDTKKGICLGEYCEPPTQRIKDPNYMKRGSVEFKAVAEQIVEASQRLAARLEEWNRG